MTAPTGRWWWTATGLVLIVWALEIFPDVSQVAWTAAAVVLLVALGLGTIVVSLLPAATKQNQTERTHLVWWLTASSDKWETRVRRAGTVALPWMIALTVVGAFILWSLLQVRADPTYSTDEIAFDQYAATLALHGSNPYTHSMEPAFALYHLSPNAGTFRLNGTIVTSLSYPALSFEAYLPFLALGWSTQLAVGINVLSWALALLLLFGMLPKDVRPSALVIGSLATFTGYAVGGVTDALYVPLLLLAAYFWDRSATARGPTAWISPVCFGLAMALKQTPWLVLPFALIGIAAEHRKRTGKWGVGKAGQYLAIASGVFLLPNLPYLIGAPHQWLDGVLTPIINHTVPAGQGLIGLSLFLHIGGGSLTAYAVTTVVVFVSLAAIYAATYPHLRGWTFVLPSLVLFFAARSFGSYLVMLAPIAFLAAATNFRDETPPGEGVEPLAEPAARLPHQRPWRYWPAVVGGAVAVSGVAVGVALTSAPPLDVAVSTVHTTGQLATVERISVTVHNNTSKPERPSFTIQSGGVVTAFWKTEKPESPVGPHRTARYTLVSPNFGAQPSISGGFAVDAFTSKPDAASVSNTFLPSTLHVALEPDQFSKPVPLGQRVVMRAELLNRYNQPVDLSGIPIYLGQIIYGQHGLIYSEAIVNNAPAGQTPVAAYTNDQGQATFVIKGTHAATDPVYFEANLVNFTQFYPYGYSQIVLIRFGNSP